jgi:hypothetical protein
MRLDRVQCRATVLALGDDVELRPRGLQQRNEVVAQQGFVFGDDAVHGND